MKKFIPYEKLSKKEKKKIDAQKRSDWGLITPVSKPFKTDKTQYTRKQKHKRAPERELFPLLCEDAGRPQSPAIP